MDELATKAMSWALRTKSLRVYPVPTKEMYTTKVGRSTRTIPKVQLCIEMGNAKHMGKEIYQQDEAMTDKINQIYIHYYNKAHERNN